MVASGGAAAAARMTRAAVLRGGAPALASGLLAACAASGTSDSGGAATAVAARRPVTLLVDNDWTAGDRIKVIQAWLEHANRKYPHIKTDLRQTAETQEKSIAMFAADQQGDLVQLDQHLVPVFGPKGSLQEIGSTLAALKFDANSVYDVNNITHWEGKRHGLIVQLNVNTWVYNQSAFREAGVPEPAPTWTWDDFLERARRLHQPQDGRWGAYFSHSYPYTWFWSAGVPYMDAKGTKTSWDTPAGREVLQWWADLVLRHRVAPSPRVITDSKLDFHQGHYAIVSYSNLNPAATTRAIDGRFQWEIAPTARHPKTGKAVTLVSGHNYLATVKAKQRGVLTESVQVLTAFFDPEIQDLYNSGLQLNSLAPLKATAAKTASLPGMPRNYALALDVIPQGQNFDKVVGFVDFARAFAPEFAKALDGEVTLEQAASNMTRASDAALAQAAR
jgi:multiple sugar transport system substrate-binding protein